jgi:hypothetical protein
VIAGSFLLVPVSASPQCTEQHTAKKTMPVADSLQAITSPQCTGPLWIARTLGAKSRTLGAKSRTLGAGHLCKMMILKVFFALSTAKTLLKLLKLNKTFSEKKWSFFENPSDGHQLANYLHFQKNAFNLCFRYDKARMSGLRRTGKRWNSASL